MTGHAIRDGRAVCLEPETALCRAKWDYQSCGCEYFNACEQNPDGTWVHYANDEFGDDDPHTSVGAYPAGQCNTCNWLNEALHESGPAETWASGLYLLSQHPDGLIEVEWTDDNYWWDYTEPRVIGKTIALCAVAGWVEDEGYEWEGLE